jgi:hypothetical protein
MSMDDMSDEQQRALAAMALATGEVGLVQDRLDDLDKLIREADARDLPWDERARLYGLESGLFFRRAYLASELALLSRHMAALG